MFLADIPQRVLALQNHLEARDTNGLAFPAHAIKGAASWACCETLRRLALALEQAGKLGDFESARSCLENLCDELAKIREGIQGSSLLDITAEP